MAINQYPRRPLGSWSSWLLGASLLLALERPANARSIEGAKVEVVALAEHKAAQAFNAYQGNHYTEAVALYVEAYDEVPNPDILFNIAYIYDTKLGDRRLAIDFYRRFIVDPRAVVERVLFASRRLFALQQAERTKDRPGRPPAAEAASAGVESQEAARSSWSAPEVLGVVTAGAGIAAIAAGAGFGIAALREAQTVHELCDGNMCREERGVDATEAAARHAGWSTIGFVSGSALLALGAVSYFLIGGEARQREEQAVAYDIRISERSGGWSLELGGEW